jgi:hypothetical protein
MAPRFRAQNLIAQALGVGVEELYRKATKRPLPAKTHENTTSRSIYHSSFLVSTVVHAPE